MATLATFFRETSAKRSGRFNSDTAAAQRLDAVHGQAARIKEDAYLLRALPHDDIYFYSKRIDNQRLVRQADPESRGECWSAVGAAAVLLMLGASIIAPHVGSVLAGYRLEALKTERQSLINQKRELEVREAGLLSPERLNDLAKAHSLGSPASNQVFHLEASSVDGNLASNQTPVEPTRTLAAPAQPITQ
jgi:hypothetical protein